MDNRKNKGSGTVRHLWSVLCSGHSIDTRTNNISLFSVIEQVQLQKEAPVGSNFILSVELITLWQVLEKTTDPVANVEVQVLDPNSQIVEKLEYKLEAPLNIRRVRSISKINGLKINTPGIYTFVVSVNSGKNFAFNKVAEVPLEITLK